MNENKLSFNDFTRLVSCPRTFFSKEDHVPKGAMA
jgi:hypothetical protein